MSDFSIRFFAAAGRHYLLPEQIPEVEPLRIHQEVVDCEKVCDTDDERYRPVDDCTSHDILSLKPCRRIKDPDAMRHVLTGALNSGKPIEKPQADGTGDIENHFADRDFQIAVRWSRWCC